jgi:geranylgeranyl transferase type-1 subunit beta
MSLAILRAPLDRLDIAGLAGFLRSCQTDDGSFSPLASDDCYISAGFQNDVRMTYCASVTSSVIGGVFNDVDSVARFVARCQVRLAASAR